MARTIKSLALALFAGLSLAAEAHASINPLAPMEDTVLPSDTITLTFTQPVAVQKTKVELSGPRGPVAVGRIYSGGDAQELVVSVSNGLPAGTYFLRFSAFSLSGEPINGVTSVVVPERSNQGIGTSAAFETLTGR